MRSKFLFFVIGIGFIIVVGTVGYMLLEGWGMLDSLYMTVITITTVGFGEVHRLSQMGQIFTIVLIISSIGIVTYGIGDMFRTVMEGNLNKFLRERRMSKILMELNNHFIVCGAGETGKSVIKELQRAKVQYVVIESNQEKVEDLKELKIPIYHGNATHDEMLEKMRIKQAKGVITALNNDADNVFAVLSCRELNPNLHIVARSIEPSSEAKLKKAGADIVVSPNEIGGQRMAVLALNRDITKMMDIVSNNKEDSTINVFEIKIDRDSSLAGKSLQNANVRVQTGLTVLAIIRDNEKFLNPSPDIVFEINDRLMVLGGEEQVNKFREMYEK